MQLSGFLFWFVLDLTGFTSVFTVLIIHILFTGLVSGGSYVYGYYMMYEDKSIPNNLRELILNVSFNFSDVTLIAQAIICLLLDNTLFS